MSRNDVIVLAWMSPFILMLLMIPPALGIFLCQKIVPYVWRRYPRWWRTLPGRTGRTWRP